MQKACFALAAALLWVACNQEADPGATGAAGAAAPPQAAEAVADAAEEESELDAEPEEVVVAVDQEPVEPSRTLEAIRKSGVLRVLVHQVDPNEGPRAGSLADLDRGECRDVAAGLGVVVRFVAVPERSGLLPALSAGKGDIVGDTSIAGAAEGVSYTYPLRQTSVLLAAAVGEAKVPKKSKDLRGAKVAAHADLATWLATRKLQAEVVPASERDDAEDLLAALGAAGAGLAVVRQDQLDSYTSYSDDVRTGLVLGDKVPVAWALHGDAKELVEAINGLIYSRALTSHQSTAYKPDLAEILTRKVIRVAMLNNAASYFVYRGKEVGFQYDLAKLLARRLGVRLQVVVPDKPGDMMRLLQEGLADVAPFAVSEAPVDGAVTYTTPIMLAEYRLVQSTKDTPITKPEELARAVVHVRRSSTYWAPLEVLKGSVAGLSLVEAPEELETEDLIDRVARGEVPMTVSNSILLDVERTYRDDVVGTLVLAEKQPLVYGVRAEAKELLARVDRFVREERSTRSFRHLTDRYFKDTRNMARLQANDVGRSGKISPFDDITRPVAKRYGLDWRLVTAQMYQESRFDHKARSWVGALGLLQIMPRTGRELGVLRKKDLLKPDVNIEAAVRYLRSLMDRFEPELELRQRIRFALASYNAGFHHVKDARLLAKKEGLDPNRWFENVEKAITLLEKKKYYRKARYGFCRGTEPAGYVSRIQAKYDAYVAAAPE